MFKFELGDHVTIMLGNLPGTIAGRTEYIKHPNLYQVHHLDATGNPVYAWFDEDDLT